MTTRVLEQETSMPDTRCSGKLIYTNASTSVLALSCGAGRRAPSWSWLGGQTRREDGRVPARKRSGRARAGPGLVAGRPEGSPRFPAAAAAPRQYLSTLFLSPPPLAGPGSAGGGWEDAGPTVTSPSAVRRAAKRPEGGERHTKNAVSGGGERRRQIRDGNSRPRPLVPPPPELGPRPRRQCGRASAPRASECGRLRSPGPYLTVLASPSPLPAGWAPARGRGAPSLPQRGRKSVRGRRARQLANGEKFAAPPQGGAAPPAPGVRGHSR
ncbi:translation initiation factor IF-2 [Mustela putorius furo]|uniref:Translation initiation factor IF-2 n=1 Tax=Mustela putorius furo TaxID=9669 RepID=A0A8U0RI30_MUSPF|nr:translation initiation factor IF-2 [Mustela putorius furo]